MKQKELQKKIAKAEMSASSKIFDLARIQPEHYAAPLAQLFHSPEWVDKMQLRNKTSRLCLSQQEGVRKEGMKRIMDIDKQLGTMLLNALVFYYSKVENARSSRNITLQEYVKDFIKTPEQWELYKDFQRKIDTSVALADMTETMLTDAKDILHKIDPECLLAEFDGIKSALKPLQNFSKLRYRNWHPDLMDMYTDYISDLEVVVNKHTIDYVNAFKKRADELLEKGEIKKNTFCIAD